MQKEMMQRLQTRDNENSLRRVNYIEESDEESEEDDKDQLVLRVDGDGCKLFTWKGKYATTILKQCQFLILQNGTYRKLWGREK